MQTLPVRPPSSTCSSLAKGAAVSCLPPRKSGRILLPLRVKARSAPPRLRHRCRGSTRWDATRVGWRASTVAIESVIIVGAVCRARVVTGRRPPFSSTTLAWIGSGRYRSPSDSVTGRAG
ncbi:hypothetical protein CDCA_CDCA03G0937 [Cyanidium caldarium]|uniref:Uncharacterized protein n=1 Tax=Cyanidium caldarium TaxID=2771 RepID=A0AAV9IRD1_CYACA|nr:hypothetical protein CDCA_CDCA03G0937 [Cyanidium caldarium]